MEEDKTLNSIRHSCSQNGVAIRSAKHVWERHFINWILMIIVSFYFYNVCSETTSTHGCVWTYAFPFIKNRILLLSVICITNCMLKRLGFSARCLYP